MPPNTQNRDVAPRRDFHRIRFHKKVVRRSRFVKDEARDFQTALPSDLNREQRVIDSAKSEPRDNHQWEPNPVGEIGHRELVGQRAEQSSRSFDNKQVAFFLPGFEAVEDRLPLDSAPRLPRRDRRRKRREKPLWAKLVIGNIAAQRVAQPVEVVPMWATIRVNRGSATRRLESSDAMCGIAQLAHDLTSNVCLADAGISSGDEQSSHFSTLVSRLSGYLRVNVVV